MICYDIITKRQLRRHTYNNVTCQRFTYVFTLFFNCNACGSVSSKQNYTSGRPETRSLKTLKICDSNGSMWLR